MLMLHKSYSKDSVKYKKITNKLATFISCANVATILVENREFHDLQMEQDSPSKAGYASSGIEETN